MASYEQAPNPQPYSFQPYNLPYNDIMKTVQAKTQYWLQGANQLKSAYQQAAGLDLSLDSNRNSLRDFTDQANKQVTEAAKSDLSQGDNINNAMNIFKPLYDGTSELSQNIMGDHALTTRAKQVQQQFEEAKTKNNGKEYSPINEQYALQSYQDFVRNGDPKGWKAAYQNLKSFTPYYDYHKELNDNIKNCKGSSNTSTGVNGMYITTSTTSGVDANQMAGCLGSNLSSNAEQQMSMEGSVRYGRNYQALADDYQPVAQQNRNVILSQKAQLAAALIDPKTSPEMKASFTQQIKAYDAQVANIDEGVGAIQKGDLSYIKNNYEQLAGAVYRGQKISSMAGAFAHADHTTKIQGDPVQMMLSREQHENNMLTQRENFDQSLEGRKESFEMKKLQEENRLKIEFENQKNMGQITPMIPATNPDNATKKTQVDFQNEKTVTAAQIDASEQSLYQHLSTSPVTKDIVVGQPTGATASVFASSKAAILGNPNILKQDPWLAAWKDKADKLQLDRNIQQSTEQAIQNSAPVTTAKNAVKSFINGINRPILTVASSPDFNSSTPINLSSADIQELLTNNATSSGLVLSKDRTYTSSGYMTPAVAYDKDVLVIHGQKYTVPIELQHLIDQREQHVKGYSDVIDNAYNQHYVSNPTWGNLAGYNGPEKKQLQATLRANLSGIMTIPEDKDLNITATGWDGRVQFSVPANTKGNFPDASALTVAARNMGLANIVPVPGVPGMYEASGVSQFNRQGDVLFAHKLQQFAENLQTIAQQSGSQFQRTPMIQDYHGINITAMPDPHGGLIYELQDKDNPSQINYATSPTQLISFLSQLKGN